MYQCSRSLLHTYVRRCLLTFFFMEVLGLSGFCEALGNAFCLSSSLDIFFRIYKMKQVYVALNLFCLAAVRVFLVWVPACWQNTGIIWACIHWLISPEFSSLVCENEGYLKNICVEHETFLCLLKGCKLQYFLIKFYCACKD